MEKVGGEEVSGRDVGGGLPNNSSKAECSRLAFVLWRPEERMQALFWGWGGFGIRWDLDSGEKNRVLGVVFQNLPWASEVPVPILTV